MLQIVHKILAVIIAIVVVLSTMSFTIEKHVCMGEVTSTSYFSDADSCGMIMNEEECSDGILSHDTLQKEKCCNNIQELIPGNQNEQQAIDSFELNQVQFIVAFTYTYLNLFKENINPISSVDYSPPLVDKNIQVLYQTFLI